MIVAVSPSTETVLPSYRFGMPLTLTVRCPPRSSVNIASPEASVFRMADPVCTAAPGTGVLDAESSTFTFIMTFGCTGTGFGSGGAILLLGLALVLVVVLAAGLGLDLPTGLPGSLPVLSRGGVYSLYLYP